MENQLVRQRVNIIAGHLAAAPEDISAIATHIFPMSCSNSLNSVIRRCDNRTLFARQGSSAQASFMKQVSSDQIHQSSTNSLNSANWRCDNKLFFARQASSAQGFFMRQISTEQGSQSQPVEPLKSPYCANKANNSFEAPVFSRPARAKPSTQSVGGQESAVESAPEAPKFARPNRVGRDSWSYTKERTPDFGSNESKWSPRMDVAESARSYVITIELPGVSVDDIRVEVSEQNLTVTGNRSAQISKVASYSNDLFSTFHKKEIFLGPYQVVWSLPTNTDKDRVSADFADGLLRITIPKLSETNSRVMKANI